MKILGILALVVFPVLAAAEPVGDIVKWITDHHNAGYSGGATDPADKDRPSLRFEGTAKGGGRCSFEIRTAATQEYRMIYAIVDSRRSPSFWVDLYAKTSDHSLAIMNNTEGYSEINKDVSSSKSGFAYSFTYVQRPLNFDSLFARDPQLLNLDTRIEVVLDPASGELIRVLTFDLSGKTPDKPVIVCNFKPET